MELHREKINPVGYLRTSPKDTVLSLVIRVLSLHEERKISIETIHKGFDVLLQQKCIRKNDIRCRKPDVSFENNWTSVYLLTSKGKWYAEKMIETHKDIIARATDLPSVPKIDDFSNSNTTPQPRVKDKPKKKRRSKAERRGILEEAIDHQEAHPSMTDDEIVKMFKLERGALSKPEALRLKDERIKRQRENAKYNRIVDKHIGDDLVHNNTGMSKR